MMLTFNLCHAQVPPSVQQQMEARAEAEGAEIQLDGHYLQQLEYFKKHPININATSPEELEQLRILSEAQIKSLVEYEKFAGKLIDIYELQAVPGFDVNTIRKLLAYIIVGQAVSLKENLVARLKGDQNILLRSSRVMQRAAGYQRSPGNYYLGGRDHLMLQYRFQYKDLLYFGLSADKDAGEQFFRGAQKAGFDFYSLHLFLRKLGWVKALAIGDFTVSFGQGLIQWQSFAMGKSSATMEIKRSAPALSPYRSAGENKFNRGIGLTAGTGPFEATGFVSYRKISAHLGPDSTDAISSINSSGYFRTPAEIQFRNNTSLFSFGGNLKFEKKAFRVAFNITGHRLGMPVHKGDKPYNYYSYSGSRLLNSSLDYSFTFRNLHFFGETAADRRGSLASVNGMLVSVDRNFDLSFLYRNLQKQYASLNTDAFTENSKPANEAGLYVGLAFRPTSTVEANVYADMFRFPWLKFRTNAPACGSEYLVQVAFHPTKQIDLSVRYQYKNKPLNAVSGLPIEAPEPAVRQNLRMQFVDQIDRTFSLKGRIELLWYNRGTTVAQRGSLFFVEAASKIFVKISSDLRLQYFETDGYDSRLYAYEADLLYGSSVIAFFQKGFRYYFNASYKWSKKFSTSLRWSGLIYQNQDQIGSGLDLIQGRKKEEIKIQLLLIL